MNPNPSAADWVASRGDKWLAQLSGMEAMLAPVNEPLIRTLRLNAPCRIAEVGCGGGGTALELLRRAPTGSVVHGFDISPGLIHMARARMPPDAADIAFEVADMATTPPKGRAYDRLVSRFGVMFFDDPSAAFANLVPWLLPGGRFAFAVWGRVAENPWISIVRDVVARFVEMPPSAPDAPGPFRYGHADNLHALLNQSGFADVAVDDWQGSLPVGGGLAPGDAARFALAAFSSFGEQLAKSGDSAIQNAEHALTEQFSQHQENGVVRLGARVHLVTGTREA